MAKYTSRYAELSFYVAGEERKFSAGVYEATTPEEIAVLDRLTDAIKTEETVQPAPKQRKPAAAKTSEK
ncbi:hypothetical protein G5B47_02095 [Paenibacillus sp. 7124]|uniref:Uncharacterized protein n=1 Tax=Paenibacillus apii TaxID=1850370 RepID=A0A6M1PFT1_9BACL|nr:hypothetical protein [Paenibacillus apii]NGM81198.1 hypothetical protein [Paenibacillus apii]